MEHPRRCSMPWSQTSPMDQRVQFISEFLRHSLSITDLCDLYGVSRKTGYKWIDRYLRLGPEGLVERSRRPACAPNATSQEIVAALIEVRQRHRSWGAKKLLAIVHQRHPRWNLPGRSTVCDILKRHGMVPQKRYRRHIGHPGKPTQSDPRTQRCVECPTLKDSSKQEMGITVIH